MGKKKTKPVIIDVREQDEFINSHFPGAINIPILDLVSDPRLKDFTEDTRIIVYCRTGIRSGVAKNILTKLGFKNVADGVNQQHMNNLIS